MLPRSSIEAACARAERIRVAFAENCRFVEDHQVDATVSCGLAASVNAEQTLSALLELSDVALYRAKTEGEELRQARRPAQAGRRPIERDPRGVSIKGPALTRAARALDAKRVGSGKCPSCLSKGNQTRSALSQAVLLRPHPREPNGSHGFYRDRPLLSPPRISMAQSLRRPVLLCLRGCHRLPSSRLSRGRAELDRKARPAAVITARELQLATNLLQERKYDLHSKSFAVRWVESRW